MQGAVDDGHQHRNLCEAMDAPSITVQETFIPITKVEPYLNILTYTKIVTGGFQIFPGVTFDSDWM